MGGIGIGRWGVDVCRWVGCSSWAVIVMCWLPGVFCRRAGQDEGGRGAHHCVIVKTTTKNDIWSLFIVWLPHR
jgi:hypothetical protein